jgi:hypothetical protein
MDEALARERDAPALVMRAIVAEHLGRKQESASFLGEALAIFDPVPVLTDFELSWYLTAARMQGDQPKNQEAKEEQKRRASGRDGSQVDPGGDLPATDASSEDRGKQ